MFKLNKYILRSAFLLPVIFLSACSVPGQKSEEVQTREQAQNEVKEMAKAIEGGGSAYCKLTDENGKTLEYWIKNKKMKAKGEDLGQVGVGEEGNENVPKLGYMINDSEYVYMWAEGEAEGIKMKMPTEEEVKQTVEDAKQIEESLPDFSSQEVVDEYEAQGYKVDCKQQNINDTEFVAPAAIKFQDMSVLTETALQKGKEGLKNIDAKDLESMKQLGKEMEGKLGN